MKQRRHIAHAAPIKRSHPKAACVYHFTSTLHLPWIVMDGQLRPSIHGDEHYLWATTNPDGDPTAFPLRPINDLLSAFYSERGQLLIVRFTLPATGFVDWDEVEKTLSRKRRATWQAKLYYGERSKTWRVRRDPVPLKSVLRVDVGASGHWSRIKATRKHCHEFSDDPPTMSFEIDGFHFYSMMVGARKYDVPDRDELAAMWDGEWPENWHA